MTIGEGTIINSSNFIEVPPGSTLGSSGSTATVMGHGYISRGVGGGHSNLVPTYSVVGWQVTKVGNWPSLRETGEQFLQRARTVCYGAARDNAVRVEPVLAALRRIGAIEDPPLGVGMWLHINDDLLRERLSGKSGVVYGYGDPNIWEGYAEVDIDRERATLGGAGQFSRCVRVLAMDSPDTDLYLREPTEDDLAEVARLRGSVWVYGQQAKQQERWCPQYEAAISILGVSELCADDAPAAVAAQVRRADVHAGRSTISSSEASTERYPEGAIFEYPASGTDYSGRGYEWNWQRRCFTGSRWNTCHYLGPNSGQYGGERRVLWDGVETMSIAITMNLLGHLPIGTRLSAGSAHYYKVAMAAEPLDHDTFLWASMRDGEAVVNNSAFFRGDGSSAYRITDLPPTHPDQSPAQ